MSLPVFALILHVAPLVPHPSVFYDASDVARLRAPTTAAQTEIRTALIAGSHDGDVAPASFTDAFDRGRALTAFAIECGITGDARICTNAHTWLMYFIGLSQWEGVGTDPVDFIQSAFVSGVAIAYDILSDASGSIPAAARLTASERTSVRTRLTTEAARIYDQSASGANPTWWAQEYLQNHNWVDMSALGIAALALNGDTTPDPTCTWLDAVIADYQNVDRVVRLVSDGTWHEGYSYQGSSVAAWLEFVVPFARARQPGRVSCTSVATAPDFAANPWFQHFAHYRAVSSLPGQMHQAIIDHGDWFGFSSDEVVFSLRFAAAHFHDGEAEWLAEQQLTSQPHNRYGYEQDFTALEYLVFDPAVSPSPATATDLYLSDLMGYVTRSGYQHDAAVLGVKAGDFGGVANWTAAAAGGPGALNVNFGHNHDDDLGFWFFANGEWLAPEADGYAVHGHCTGGPAIWNASYHNTFTIDSTGQLGDDEPCRDSADMRVPWSRQSSVTAHTATSDLAYAAMEGAQLYPASLGLDTLSRQVVFLDRACVVTRDTLHANASHRYYWHTHAIDAAIHDGDWIRAESKHDQALGIRVVAPASWMMDTATDSPPHGPNANEYIDPDQDITHVRVWPAAAANGARFLMVMCPTTITGWAARPTVTPLGDVQLARGFTIVRGGVTGAWLFGDGPTSVVTDGGAMSLTGVLGGVETSSSGTTYYLVRGSVLGSGGHEVLSGDATSGSLEAQVRGSTVTVSADGATRARVFAMGATQATWNGASVSVQVDPTDARYVLIPGTPTAMDAGVPDASALDASGDASAMADANGSRDASGVMLGDAMDAGDGSGQLGGGCHCRAAKAGDARGVPIGALAIAACVAMVRRRRSKDAPERASLRTNGGN